MTATAATATLTLAQRLRRTGADLPLIRHEGGHAVSVDDEIALRSSVYQGDRADRRAVGSREPEGQRQKAAALHPDLVQIREVLHDGDAGREEPVVGRALLAREFRPRREDPGAYRVVGRIVVADDL